MVASNRAPSTVTRRPTIESVTSQFASSTLTGPHSQAKNTDVDGSNIACLVDSYKGVPGFPDFPLFWCGEEGGGTRGRSESVRGVVTLERKEECQQSSSLSLVGFEAGTRKSSNRKKFSFIRRAVNVVGIKRDKLNREISVEKDAITKAATRRNKKWQLRDPHLLCKRMSSLQIKAVSSTDAAAIIGMPTTTTNEKQNTNFD